MTNEKDATNKSNEDFISDPKENILLGAKVFSEKASDIFSNFLDKLKQTAEAAYEKGSEIYETVSLSAQHYLERYKDRSEMAKLQKDKDEVAIQLGYMCFMEYSGRYRFRVEFMKNEELKKLMAQMRELDKQIIQIGERFESEAQE
jgi:hypothetical protein